MGTYYTIVCHERREVINPGKVGGGNIKASFVFGSAGRLLAHTMIDRWYGCAVIIEGDNSEEQVDRRGAYAEVSREAIDAFNAARPFPESDLAIEWNESG